MGTPWSKILGIWLWLAGFEGATEAGGPLVWLEVSMLKKRATVTTEMSCQD